MVCRFPKKQWLFTLRVVALCAFSAVLGFYFHMLIEQTVNLYGFAGITSLVPTNLTKEISAINYTTVHQFSHFVYFESLCTTNIYEHQNFNGNRLRTHHIKKLFYHIDKRIFVTYPQWANKSMVSMQIQKIHRSTDAAKTHTMKYFKVTNCFLYSADNWNSITHTFDIYGVPVWTSMGLVCTFDKYVSKYIEKNQLNVSFFGMSFNETLFVFKFTNPSNEEYKKHYITASIHNAFWGYPPLKIFYDFIHYYLSNGVTQFYFYHYNDDLWNFLQNTTNLDSWHWPKLGSSGTDIEIWFHDMNNIYSDEHKYFSYGKRSKEYTHKKLVAWWIVDHFYHATMYNSQWNIAIDVDEFVIPRRHHKTVTLLEYVQHINERKVNAIVIKRKTVDYRICWMYDRSHNAIERNILSNDTTVFDEVNHLEVMIVSNRGTCHNGKIMYQTSKIKKLNIHRCDAKQEYRPKSSELFIVHQRTAWSANKCQVLLNETMLHKYDGFLNVDYDDYCIDQRMKLEKPPLKIDIPEKWRC